MTSLVSNNWALNHKMLKFKEKKHEQFFKENNYFVKFVSFPVLGVRKIYDLRLYLFNFFPDNFSLAQWKQCTRI